MAGYILYSTPNEEKDKEIKELELQEKREVYGLNEEYRKLGEAYFEKISYVRMCRRNLMHTLMQ